jgi:hypothetical protein
MWLEHDFCTFRVPVSWERVESAGTLPFYVYQSSSSILLWSHIDELSSSSGFYSESLHMAF